jgi:hypothetical protein
MRSLWFRLCEGARKRPPKNLRAARLLPVIRSFEFEALEVLVWPWSLDTNPASSGPLPWEQHLH